MSVFQSFSAASDPSQVERIVQQVIENAKTQEDAARRKSARKLLDFYNNRIEGYIFDILKAGGFKKPTEKFPSWLNAVKKFADTKAQLFQEDPTITVMLGDDPSESDQELWDWLAERGAWNDKFRVANVWEKLLGTFHIRVHRVGDDDNAKLNLNLLSPHITLVGQSGEDPSVADYIMYKVHQMIDSATPAEDIWVLWSDEHHFIVDGRGMVQAPHPDNPEKINPFGINPVVKISNLMQEDDTYWSEGALDMVSANEAFIVGLVSLVHGQVHTGWKQMWSRNFDAAALSDIGPDMVVAQSGLTDGDQPAELGVVDLAAELKQLWESMEFILQEAVLLNNIPPGEFRIDAPPESGFSKVVSRLPLETERKQDTPKWRRNFNRLFRVIKAVWDEERNALPSSHPMKTKNFNKDATLAVDFVEPTIIESDMERLARQEKEIEMGLASRLDVMMERNPDLNEDQAREKLEQIVRDNRETDGANILQAVGLLSADGRIGS